MARSPLVTLRALAAAFAPQLRGERRLLIGSMALLAAEVLFKALEPWPIKLVIDRLANGSLAATPNGGTTFLLLAAAGLVAATSLRAAATYGSTLGFSLAGNRLLAAVRLRLVEHLHRLSLAFHHRARSGDLVQRLSRDVDLVKEVLVTALLPLVGNVLTLVVLAGAMMVMNWRLALVALAVIPIFLVAARRLVPRIQDAARTQRRREGVTAAQLTETLGAMREVQSLALETSVGSAAKSREAASVKDDVRGRVLAARLERSVDILTAIASALVVSWGARLAMAGQVTPGDLVVFLSYLKSAYKPLQDLAKYIGRMAKALVAGERILEVLDEVPEIQDRPDAIDAPALRGAIQFDRVRFGYDADRSVLDDLDLEIEPGSVVALMGPSGHGKTTIASLLLRLYDPTAGAIRIDGRDLRDYRVASIRRQIAVVPQDSILFGVSIRQNLLLGNPAATDAELRAAARIANADSFITGLPAGYDTVLGERGAKLSTGQRQRIALARAALRPTPIVILDEPTTGLDEENRRLVGAAILELARGRTTLIITHDRDLAERADRVIRLDRGRIHDEVPLALA